jgi:hypothetical protein
VGAGCPRRRFRLAHSLDAGWRARGRAAGWLGDQQAERARKESDKLDREIDKLKLENDPKKNAQESDKLSAEIDKLNFENSKLGR